MIINESKRINETKLTPAKISWYGTRNVTMPDGTPEMSGSNKILDVHVLYEDGYCVVALMGDEGEHMLQKDEFKTSSDAIKFADKLLSEVKDDKDPKATARKYKMMYFNN